MELEAIAGRGLERESLRRLSRRSNLRGTLQLSAHLMLLCITGCIIWASRGSLLIVPAIVLHGIVLNFLFCPLHETVHLTAFASRRVNVAVSWACGPLLLLPPRFFARFHFAHHRFTQDPARDPELAAPNPTSVGTYLWRASGLPNWHRRLCVTLRHALTGRVSEPFVSAGERPAIVREARILWSGYLAVLGVSLFLRSADALLYWVQGWLRLFGQKSLRDKWICLSG